MKELMTAVMKRLNEQVPELGWVDINIGQMATENPSVNYPCALLDISEGVFSDASCGIQMGELTLDVELYFAMPASGSETTAEELREQASGYFGLAEKVYLALQGFSGETFSRLARARMNADKEHHPRCFRLQFTCTTRDESAKTVWTKVNLRPATEKLE